LSWYLLDTFTSLTRYCREQKESQELERLLHCDGIWLHALRYKGRGWCFQAPTPAWAIAEGFGSVQFNDNDNSGNDKDDDNDNDKDEEDGDDEDNVEYGGGDGDDGRIVDDTNRIE
jgi:hypothetical protein